MCSHTVNTLSEKQCETFCTSRASLFRPISLLCKQNSNHYLFIIFMCPTVDIRYRYSRKYWEGCFSFYAFFAFSSHCWLLFFFCLHSAHVTNNGDAKSHVVASHRSASTFACIYLLFKILYISQSPCQPSIPLNKICRVRFVWPRKQCTCFNNLIQCWKQELVKICIFIGNSIMLNAL